MQSPISMRQTTAELDNRLHKDGTAIQYNQTCYLLSSSRVSPIHQQAYKAFDTDNAYVDAYDTADVHSCSAD